MPDDPHEFCATHRPRSTFRSLSGWRTSRRCARMRPAVPLAWGNVAKGAMAVLVLYHSVNSRTHACA